MCCCKLISRKNQFDNYSDKVNTCGNDSEGLFKVMRYLLSGIEVAAYSSDSL